jgi:hypothetical protein
MIIACTNNAFQACIGASGEADLFAHIQKWLAKFYPAGKHAVIAGSYALHSFMCSSGQSEFTEQHEFVPNDIDIYVNAQIPTIFWMVSDFFDKHTQYGFTNLEIRGQYPGNQTGVKGILEFRLISWDKASKVQFICWNPGMVFCSAYQLGHAVIRSFDISVCRVAMTSSQELNKYYFCDNEDAVDIYMHRFRLQMKPREMTRTVFRRILKYTQRGFRLYQLCFQEGVISGSFRIAQTYNEEE